MIKLSLGIIILTAAVLNSSTAWAQENRPVTRAEYNQLLKELEELKAKVKAVKPAAQSEQIDENLNYFNEQLEAVKSLAESGKPGKSNFLLSGYGAAGFTDRENQASQFSAGLSPVFLWKVSDKFLFESELELELDDGDTEVHLEYAQITYLLHDYVTVGAGKFLLPFGTFGERLHPAWINKLPDAPIFRQHHGGFTPMTEVGAQVRGGIPLVANAKMNYAFFVSNGPQLADSGHHAGELGFGSASDNNGNKAVGGRIGLLPIPELELGFSFMTGQAGESGKPTSGVDAFLWSTDLSYVRPSELLKGTFDARFEWVRSEVDAHPTLLMGDDNTRDGWYAQLAYRPDKLDSFLKDCEIVGRYDTVDLPSRLNKDEDRFTLGLNYWFNPSTLFKLAYQFDDHENAAREADAVMAQFAIGF